MARTSSSARSPYTVEAFALGQPPLQLTTKFSILARQRRCRRSRSASLTSNASRVYWRARLYRLRSGWASATSCARLYTIRLLLVNLPGSVGAQVVTLHGVTSRSYPENIRQVDKRFIRPYQQRHLPVELSHPSPLFRLPAMVRPRSARPHAAGRIENAIIASVGAWPDRGDQSGSGYLLVFSSNFSGYSTTST